MVWPDKRGSGGGRFTVMKPMICIFAGSLLAAGAVFGQGTESPSGSVGTVINKSVVPTGATASSGSRGVVIANGSVYSISGGQVAQMQQPMSLRVLPDGTVTGFDGKPYQIPPGQMLMMDGRLAPIPQGIQGLPNGVYVGSSQR